MTEQEAEIIEKVLDIDFGGDDLDRACFERLKCVAKWNGYGSAWQLLIIAEKLMGKDA